MLSSVTPYSLLKMHWSPEHASPLSQWPEQHLDVSSTTSPPSALKHDPYATAGRRGYAAPGYPWASDDISALTASSLLKRYAEKYSGLDLPYERPASGLYAEPGPFLKTESEPWPMDGGYPGLEALAAGAKAGSAPLLPSDPGYGGAGPCGVPASQDYPPAYNSAYLPSGYCSQSSTALPPPTLHSLQPAATLVPSYSPGASVYNYPPGCYPHPATQTSSYSHPSASYLSAPTPLTPRPTVVGGSYAYPTHSLGGATEAGAPPPSLKRKAFEMAEEREDGGGEADGARYGKYGNGHGKSHGYEMSGSASDGRAYKAGYSAPSGLAGDSAPGDHSFPLQQRLSMKMPGSPTGGR